MEDINIILHLI